MRTSLCPACQIVPGRMATSEALRHSRAAPTPLQAVGDAASCTMVVVERSALFGGSVQWEPRGGRACWTAAAELHPPHSGLTNRTLLRRTVSGALCLKNVKRHVTGAKTWTAAMVRSDNLLWRGKVSVSELHLAWIPTLTQQLEVDWKPGVDHWVVQTGSRTTAEAVRCGFKWGFPKVWSEGQGEIVK